MSNRPWLVCTAMRVLTAIGALAALFGAAPARAQDDPHLYMPDFAPPEALPPGIVRIDGIPELYPLIFDMGEAFHARYPDVDVQVGFGGDEAALARFCAGQDELALDIALLARYPEEGDLRQCSDTFHEMTLGYAAVAVVTYPGNQEVDCLSIDELNHLWAPEAEGIVTQWNQVREGLPDMPLTVYGPEPDRFPFDFFTRRIVGDAGAIRLDYVPGTVEETVQRVAVPDAATRPGVLAFVDLQTFWRRADDLLPVAVDDGRGCTLPEPENVQRGDYPLAHPLVALVHAEALDQEAVRVFLMMLLQRVWRGDGALDGLGFVTAPADLWEGNLEPFPELALRPAYVHPSGYFHVAVLPGWEITTEDEQRAIWVNAQLKAEMRALVLPFDAPVTRREATARIEREIAAGADSVFFDYDSFDVVTTEFGRYPAIVGGIAEVGGRRFFARHWIGWNGPLMWCLGIAVPEGQLELLERLAGNFLPTFRVFPDVAGQPPTED